MRARYRGSVESGRGIGGVGNESEGEGSSDGSETDQ